MNTTSRNRYFLLIKEGSGQSNAHGKPFRIFDDDDDDDDDVHFYSA